MMRTAHEQVAAVAAATARDRALIAARQGGSMEAGDQLAALIDVAAAFDRARIPYALIGGIAVGIHASAPRATADIGIAAPTSVSRQKVTSALTGGFALKAEFAHSLNFRHQSDEPVQVAFDEFFDQMIDRAEALEVAQKKIRVVRKDDLIAMKERAGHDPAWRRSKALRDQADAELLRGDVPEPDEGW
jgi:hypothetical protein